MAIRPRCCFIYTTDESLTAALADGSLTEHDAKATRDFRDWLGVRSEMIRRIKEEGNMTRTPP
jgi:hypothetical protein